MRTVCYFLSAHEELHPNSCTPSYMHYTKVNNIFKSLYYLYNILYARCVHVRITLLDTGSSDMPGVAVEEGVGASPPHFCSFAQDPRRFSKFRAVVVYCSSS